jgi:uncharacterized membrane protein
MNAPTPIARSIPEYLEQLRAALAGADPALIQDALYDAEDYLRSEWAEHPELDEAGLLASVAGSYGAPSEVADIYRETEVTVNQALRVPAPRSRASAIADAAAASAFASASGPTSAGPAAAAAATAARAPAPPRSALSSFFGVLADPRAYTSLLYMLLSLATGIFYFAWAVTGLSLSAGFAVLIIGIPFTIIFFASVRLLSLVEGRLVEAMLGERMPRRPPYADPNQGLLARIKELFLDIRTWSSFVYFLLMLPLGICYFAIAVVSLTLSLAVGLLPLASLYGEHNHFYWFGNPFELPLWSLPITLAIGLLMLILTLHLARGLGLLQGAMAKHFLVKLGPA